MLTAHVKMWVGSQMVLHALFTRGTCAYETVI